MPKILFWNVEHLSDSSTQTKQERINGTISSQKADISAFCEVMKSSTQFETVSDHYRKETSHSLCYAAVGKDGNTSVTMSPVAVTVPDWWAGQVKGGKDVSNYLVRPVVELERPMPVARWPRIFMLHAKSGAGQGGAALAAYNIAKACGSSDWLLFGDLNCTPEQLEVWLKWAKGFDPGFGYVVAPPDRPTRMRAYKMTDDPEKAKPKSERMLDYAVHSVNVKVEVTVITRTQSDHKPIILNF